MNGWADRLLHAVDEALNDDSQALELLPSQPGQHPSWMPRRDAAAHGAAAVVRTSGSTGTPKETLLPADALRASAAMTAQALGGHGQWLLTLQPSYVAGLAVLTRSLVAGTAPVPLLERTTDPSAFISAAGRLTAERRFVSLVPTQLQRLIEEAGPQRRMTSQHEHSPEELLEVLRSFSAVLLGGAPTSPELFERAQDLGISVVRTYGMAETCGGCVYDGTPLPGVTMETDDQGRVLLSGPQVALGYTDPDLTAEKFDSPTPGPRRFRTDDIGAIRQNTLSITGRVDDVINTGGVKVSAAQVQQVLQRQPQVTDAFVAGVADPEWGQKVCAAVALSHVSRTHPSIASLNDAVREELGAAAVPKHYELVSTLPQLPNGKPDRQTLMTLLQPEG